MRGAAWTILTSVGSRILGVVGTLALTYYLVPEIIGEVSDASNVVLTAHVLSSFGIAQYLVAHPNAEKDTGWHVTVMHVTLGAIAIAASWVFATPIGHLLKAPELGQYVPGLAAAVMLERIGVIPDRLLARDLQFRTLGMARTVSEISYTLVSVVLAVRGWGGMSIVVGNVVRSALLLLLLARAANPAEWLKPKPLHWARMREILVFGVPLAAAIVSTFASRRFDNFLVSGIYGIEVVGIYNLAYNLADIPAVQVGEQIGDVLLPSFARMEPDDRKRALVRSTGLLSLVVFPLAVGLGVVAPTLVVTLLPKKWHDVAAMLTILSALSVVRPLGWTIASYLQACHRTRPVMWLSFLKVIGLLAAIATLGRINPLWACGAVGVAFGLHALASMFVVARSDGIAMSAFLGKCIPPLLACVPMVLAVLGVRYGLRAAGISLRGVNLTLEITAGAVGYMLGGLTLARGISRDFIDLIRGAIAKRRGAGETTS